jgi:transcriptional regulator with XRE-family HTH domain
MKQNVIAKSLGISPSFFSSYVAGRFGIDRETLDKLAKLLQAEASALDAIAYPQSAATNLSARSGQDIVRQYLEAALAELSAALRKAPEDQKPEIMLRIYRITDYMRELTSADAFGKLLEEPPRGPVGFGKAQLRQLSLMSPTLAKIAEIVEAEIDRDIRSLKAKLPIH